MARFLDLPPEQADLGDARAVILPLPFEATTTYGKGTGRGPAAIIEASTQVELYDEELNEEPCQIGIATARPPEGFSSDPEEAIAQISAACEVLLERGKFVVGLGGEHTVSVGLIRAYSKYFPDVRVLQLDAHSDLRDIYQGSKFNHACVMARVSEICPYVGVGVRSGVAGERAVLNPPSRLIYAHEMRRNTEWVEEVVGALAGPVYITIDLDFLDPSIMPSVGAPEPGGFLWYETLEFLRQVINSHTVVGFDVVELSPKTDLPASDFLAAKLIYKLLGYLFEDELEKS